MNSLLYLNLTSLKNRIKQLRRKPGLLILYILLIGVIVFSMISGRNMKVAFGETKAIEWLKLFFLVYLVFFIMISVSSSFSSGTTLFSMADANLLFCSPISPKLVLAQGIVQQTAKSVLASIFILMMAPTLKSMWGLALPAMFLLFAFYVFALVLNQFVGTALYMFMNGRPWAKKLVLALCILFILPTALSVIVPLLGQQNSLDVLMNTMNSPVLFTLPIAGWITIAAFSLLSGQWLLAAIALLLCLVVIAAIVFYLVLGKTDYYEDALVATEGQFEKLEAMRSGDINAGSRKGKPIGNIRTGPFRGRGASVLFFKHLREGTRASRSMALNSSMFIMLLVAVIQAFVQRQSEGARFTILVTCLMMRIFLISTGRGLRELYLHYIYLMPDAAFPKLLWSNLETLLQNFIEYIIVFTISGLILKESIQSWALCVLLATCFSMLLIAMNMFSMRVFKNVISQGLLLVFYMIGVFLISGPGIVACIIVMAILGFNGLGIALGIGACALWFLLMAALFLFLSRGILHNCDMPALPKSTR